MNRNSAIDELRLYKKASSRVRYLKNQKFKLEMQKLSIKSQSGYTIQGGIKDEGLLALIDKIDETTKDIYNAEIYELCVLNDIEKKINKLKEPYCSVLRGYYIEGKSFERLAVDLNYSFDGIKQAKRRGIDRYALLKPIYKNNK